MKVKVKRLPFPRKKKEVVSLRRRDVSRINPDAHIPFAYFTPNRPDDIESVLVTAEANIACEWYYNFVDGREGKAMQWEGADDTTEPPTSGEYHAENVARFKKVIRSLGAEALVDLDPRFYPYIAEAMIELKKEVKSGEQ